MANQQHLDLLRQGASVWNAWRREQGPNFKPDLASAHLSRADLSGIDLSRGSIESADLVGADLSGADLRHNYGWKANLSGANLRNANLRSAHLGSADLSGADLSRADLGDTYLDEANLSEAHLSGVDLKGAFLSRADLRGADLNEACLRGAHLIGAKLSRAWLIGADFRRADLSEVDLSGADLGGAILSGADFTPTDLGGAGHDKAFLINVNLSGANFRGANLAGAILREVNLSKADLSEARISGASFSDIDLRAIKGLETVLHEGPSTIGTDTISRSQGDIPEVFLRGAGLSNSFIITALKVAQHPGAYFTCIISYSRQNQDFAQRLNTDLQNRGVHSWVALEEREKGYTLMPTIFETLHLYDRLVLVLSQYSLDSSRARVEVWRALTLEQQRGRPMLFPIRLDNTIMVSTVDWVEKIRRTRPIADFTEWKRPDDYQEAFTRLLHDLQAGQPPKQEP
jgi:uncharacterized protein YjbI with pentapeptide repeats